MHKDGETKLLDRLWQVLGDGQWHSTAELVERVGLGFSAELYRAVQELDWRVETRNTDRGKFEYRLEQVGLGKA